MIDSFNLWIKENNIDICFVDIEKNEIIYNSLIDRKRVINKLDIFTNPFIIFICMNLLELIPIGNQVELVENLVRKKLYEYLNNKYSIKNSESEN